LERKVFEKWLQFSSDIVPSKIEEFKMQKQLVSSGAFQLNFVEKVFDSEDVDSRLAVANLKDSWRKWKSSTHQGKNIVFEHLRFHCGLQSSWSFRDQSKCQSSLEKNSSLKLNIYNFFAREDNFSASPRTFPSS
jgi:hypothetical protein